MHEADKVSILVIFFPSLCVSEMWYGVFLWAVVSSLVFHLPGALLSLSTLHQHKVARFMPVAILVMAVVGPVCGGVLTSKLNIHVLIEYYQMGK